MAQIRDDIPRRGKAESHDGGIARLVNELVNRVGRESRRIADIGVARRRIRLVAAAGERPIGAGDHLARRVRPGAAEKLRLWHRLLDGGIGANVAALTIEADGYRERGLLENEFRRDR